MKQLLILTLTAFSLFAQDLPSRVLFTGIGWTARQGAPTTGFGGIGLKVTDRLNGGYLWNSIVATSATNSFASGYMNRVGTAGPFTAWAVGQAGVTAGNGATALTYGGGGMVTFPAKLLLYLPTRVLNRTAWLDKIKAQAYFGAQVNQINSVSGIPFAGVNLSPGGGLAIPWGQ